MRRINRFLIYWIHNSALIYLATQIFPGKFVLGNARFSLIPAMILSGLFVTLFFEIAKMFVGKVKKPKMDSYKKHVYYLGVNFVALWIVARLAPVFGFGVVRFTWLFALAVLMNLVQKVVSLAFEKK
ncbi:hypothetical protein ACFL15_00595 [Patescibacteria group bacterium]